MGNWNIKIIDKGYKITRDVFIFRRLPNGNTEVLGQDKEYQVGEAIEPTLELEPETLQEFANALNEIGVNPQKEYVEGKLEATEKHLKDMRQLLKMKD